MYSPNDSLYIYNEAGYWKPVHGDYIEREAMDMLEDDAKSAWLSDIRKLVEKTCLMPPERRFNELNGYCNLRNGMLHLDTLELKDHDKDYLSTVQLPVTYDENAKCPRWELFLEEVFEEDQEVIDLVQEFIGYCLIPDTRQHKALLLVGEGSNGKSVLIRAVEELVGRENVSSVALADLSNQFHRARLHGKLVNIASEVDPKVVEQSDYFKRIVAGDTIEGARKHKDPFDFVPVCRLIFAMNRLPRVRDTSHGFYRRLIIAPFNRRFEGEEEDRYLIDKLLDELDGIFVWALQGLQRLQEQDDLTRSTSVEAALQDYKRMNNPVVAFVQDSCEFNPEKSTSKDTLYSEYKKYSENYGYSAFGRENFFKELYAAWPELKPARIGPRGDRERVIEGIVVVNPI